jgi:hypothetical protein
MVLKGPKRGIFDNWDENIITEGIRKIVSGVPVRNSSRVIKESAARNK